MKPVEAVEEMEHEAILDFPKGHRPFCMVCRLEIKLKKRSSDCKCTACSQKHMGYCETCDCYAHATVPFNSKWHSIEGLRGKSCFEILHAEECKGLWTK